MKIRVIVQSSVFYFITDVDNFTRYIKTITVLEYRDKK